LIKSLYQFKEYGSADAGGIIGKYWKEEGLGHFTEKKFEK